MICLVESFQLSEDARADPAFGEWLKRFNTRVMDKNPVIKSIYVYGAYTGAFEVEVWLGMESFSALHRSAEAERDMVQDPEVKEEWKMFAAYLKPLGRRIMVGVT